MEYIKIPQYDGFESSNEDIIYNYFRRILTQNGYSFKVKRTGFPEIDNLIPSSITGNAGRGSCDAYIFSDIKYQAFKGLIELETTSKIDTGIKQIQNYIKGLHSKSLTPQQKSFVNKIENRNIILIAYDGKKIYISEFNLDTQKENIIFNKLSVENNHDEITNKLYELFKKKDILNREDDEKKLIKTIAKILRGHTELQNHKALLMTILASIYGTTKQLDYSLAVKQLQNSQDNNEVKLNEVLNALLREIPERNDRNKISILYQDAAAKLYEMSQERGMDLYGFIYEELASKENKREQGEYYTPRHTIKPLIRATFINYLGWSKDELKNKIIFDPFCGSGGFLYEYIQLIKSFFDLSKKEIDKIAKKTIWGVDKNNILAAYLNLFLIGDGSANLERIKSTINWRKQFQYENHITNKYKVISISEPKTIKTNLKASISDIKTLVKLYVDKDFEIEHDDLEEYIEKKSPSPLNDFIAEKKNYHKFNKNSDFLGNVDFLMTNIPYGKVTEANEQFMEDGEATYKNSLEANGLRECIDFLKPAKLKNGRIVEEGGIAITIIPDSILENPSNKSIRDYLVSRCNILGIIGLPPYTFSPYAMEKTYALIFQKIAPEQFDYNRNLDTNAFMYYSISDGKANSENRFKTDLMTKTNVNLKDGSKKEVNIYLHNDFEPFFDSFESNKWVYKSKLEWAWDYSFANLNENFDQVRINEYWTGNSWETFEGKKWGYFSLKRYKRELERNIKSKSLQEKVDEFFTGLAEEERELYFGIDNFGEFKKKLQEEINLTPKERDKLEEISFIKYSTILDETKYQLIKIEKIEDIDLNPDSTRYLGLKEKKINIDNIFEELTQLEIKNEDDLINFFRNNFYSEKIKPIRLIDEFDIIQGTQFSKKDAYSYPGKIPVFTAATDGAAYHVSENIPNKVKLKGPSLIWSRKGAKAGTIQLFDEEGEFYISDVSGTIKSKITKNNISLYFLKYYISGQVKRLLQSKSNNAQLNKSKLENLEIYLDFPQIELANLIKEKLNLIKN